ncbi:four helix bundle protein [Winogradskyella flava]|uniref:Four helix bundle protein n=1 Tax=Winogradskyella flava TaxID=1884876 RepID=A0A842IQX5_9FLAO|nr:four helix bundle protein [Winogradskyella flava]MBC2844193.1 four helix bundle protein [Winogradskyella flava]
MAIQKFEDLLVWQKSRDLAVSISNNISEGFDRNSNADFARFLYIALSSNSEVRSMLYISVRLNSIGKQEADELIERTNEISKMLHGLIKSIKN